MEPARKRERIIIASTVTILTLVVGLRAIFIPFSVKLAKLSADIISEAQKNKALSEIAEAQKRIMPIAKRFTRGLSAGEVIDKLVEFAAKSDVRLTSIEPRATIRSNYYTITSIQIKVVAQYHKLGEFIAEIENMADNLRIENCAVSSMEKLASQERYGEAAMGGEEERGDRVFAIVTLSAFSLSKIF